MPARIQRNDGPKSRAALIPTLHVRFPGTNVLTWMWTNRDPSLLLQRTSTLGVLPSVTTAEYPLRQSSPATKNWLAFARNVLSCSIFSEPNVTRMNGYRSPGCACWPFALNPSWNVTSPCGKRPSNERAKNTSCGTPSWTSPETFSNPNCL